ncbi:MAG: ABC transporter ATP-binding protein [Desulfobacteraceae bacterium]|jgi:peptide/nickel transport system ATP-binding protein
MKLLEIENLTKIFSQGSLLSRIRITAADNVSFDIKPAEIFTLAGESGCGKTTVAKMILGFETFSSGHIIHKGKEQKEIRDRKAWLEQGIQAVFQDPFGTFNPLRQVERYFFEAVQNFKLADTKEAAIELINKKLNAVGLKYEDMAGRYPNEFSGGQLQRISIARSLLTDPDLLIADEPVSMVDASLRMSIVNLFKQLRDEYGVSVVYITHDLATAYYVSDRIAVMFRGNIVEMGSVENVLMKPKHPYTQLLRDSIPQADPKKKWKDIITLGELEQDEFLRVGCKFAGRCPDVMDVCRLKAPEDVMVDGVQVKCHKWE